MCNEYNANNTVLCGRGNRNAKNPGNLKFTSVIRSSVDKYVNASTRMDKAVVVASIASFLVNERNLQFMKYDKTTKEFSIKLSMDKIHDKVSHAVRDYIKQSQKDNDRLNQKRNAKTVKAKKDMVVKPNNNTCETLVAKSTSKKRPLSTFLWSDNNKADETLVPLQTMDLGLFDLGAGKQQLDANFTLSPLSDISEIIDEMEEATSRCAPSSVSNLIFDLGFKIEETASSSSSGGLFSTSEGECNIFSMISTTTSLPDFATSLSPLATTNLIRRVTSESDFSTTSSSTIEYNDEVVQLQPTSYDSPLPMDSSAEFEHDDIHRICDILCL